MMRAMFMEHPNDPVCQTLDMQYYLGESLVVAPIFNPEGVGNYYLPEGEYTHLLSNEVKRGGRYYSEVYDYQSLPLYVKPNTILPIGNHDSRPDYDYLTDISYHIFNLSSEATLHLPVYNIENEQEELIKLVKEDNEIIINRTSKKPAKFILRNIDHVDSSNVPFKHSFYGIELTVTDQDEITILI